jgi:hypothetical protein
VRVAAFRRVAPRVAAAEPVLLVLRRFAFPLVVVLPRLAAVFFVVDLLRGFSVAPVTASACRLVDFFLDGAERGTQPLLGHVPVHDLLRLSC